MNFWEIHDWPQALLDFVASLETRRYLLVRPSPAQAAADSAKAREWERRRQGSPSGRQHPSRRCRVVEAEVPDLRCMPEERRAESRNIIDVHLAVYIEVPACMSVADRVVDGCSDVARASMPGGVRCRGRSRSTRRDRDGHFGASSGAGTQLEVAAHQFGPLLHTDEAELPGEGEGGDVFGSGKADAVVGHR